MEYNLLELDDDLVGCSQNIDSTELNEVVIHLGAHMNNKDYFHTDRIRVYKELTISENYSNKNLRETVFDNVTFDGADLSSTGFPGSIFR